MESLNKKLEDFFGNEIQEVKQTASPQFVEGIVIDENHQLSEDAKFGNELAKNPSEWNRYFGIN
jgi:hypothetical protein